MPVIEILVVKETADGGFAAIGISSSRVAGLSQMRRGAGL